MAQKFGYSMPIALLFRMTQKMYGYMRDGNISDPLEVAAVKGANSLNDVIFDAECLNRQGRYDEEKARSQQWLTLANQEKQDDDSPDIDLLLKTMVRGRRLHAPSDSSSKSSRGSTLQNNTTQSLSRCRSSAASCRWPLPRCPPLQTCSSGVACGCTRSCASAPTISRLATQPTTSVK